MWKREDGSRTYEAILLPENCPNQENAVQSASGITELEY